MVVVVVVMMVVVVAGSMVVVVVALRGRQPYDLRRHYFSTVSQARIIRGR